MEETVDGVVDGYSKANEVQENNKPLLRKPRLLREYFPNVVSQTEDILDSGDIIEINIQR